MSDTPPQTADQPILETPALASLSHGGGGLLRNRNFMLMWGGNVVSALGDRIHMLVMLSLMGTLIGQHVGNPKYEPGTQESAQLTVMMLLPYLLFGPLMGMLADRYPRRALMLGSDLCRVVLILVARSYFLREQGQLAGAGGGSGLGGGGGGHDFMLLYGLLLGAEFLQAIFAASFTPARTALLPQLVHPTELLRANSMTTAAGTIASLLGFVVGSLLVSHSLHVAMYVDAGTYLVSALCLAGMKLKGVTQHKTELVRGEHAGLKGAWRELQGGFAYLRAHRKVLQIAILLLLYWSCGAIILSGLTGIVTHYYHLKLEYYGYFLGVIGLGMVVGAGSMSLFQRGIPKEWGIAWAMLGVGLFLLVFSLVDHWGIALVWVTLAAGCGSVLLVSLETLLQRIVPNHIRGRVMGVKEVITNLGMVGLTIPLALWSDVDAFIFLVLRILAGLVLLVGVGLLWYYYRHRPAQLSVLGSIVLRVGRGFLTFWHRYRRVGPCWVPLHGPVIVVANHTSGLDPLTLQFSSPNRIIHFMMAREYYEAWGFHWIYQAFGAIPVNRTGNDVASVRAALRALKEGKVLGLFPEGKISMDGTLQAGKTGVAALALMSGAPVVPAYISGTRRHAGMWQDFSRRARIQIRYGQPIYFGKRAEEGKTVGKEERMQAVTEEIMQAIAALGAKT